MKTVRLSFAVAVCIILTGCVYYPVSTSPAKDRYITVQIPVPEKDSELWEGLKTFFVTVSGIAAPVLIVWGKRWKNAAVEIMTGVQSFTASGGNKEVKTAIHKRTSDLTDKLISRQKSKMVSV